MKTVLYSLALGLALPALAHTNQLTQIEQAARIAARVEAGVTNLTRNEQVDLRNEMLYAYLDATDAILKKLRDPADAKFSRLTIDSDAICGPYGYHQWICSGWVDAINSFGAKTRVNWGACVFRSDTTTRVEYLRVGSTESGRMTQKLPFPK